MTWRRMQFSPSTDYRADIKALYVDDRGRRSEREQLPVSAIKIYSYMDSAILPLPVDTPTCKQALILCLGTEHAALALEHLDGWAVEIKEWANEGLRPDLLPYLGEE